MRRDVLLLTEMIEAAEQAQALTNGLTVSDLEADRQRRDAPRPSSFPNSPQLCAGSSATQAASRGTGRCRRLASSTTIPALGGKADDSDTFFLCPGQRRRHRHSRKVGTGAGGSAKRSASSPASSRAFRKVDSLRWVAPTRIRTPLGLWSGEVHQPSDS